MKSSKHVDNNHSMITYNNQIILNFFRFFNVLVYYLHFSINLKLCLYDNIMILNNIQNLNLNG